MGSVQRYARRRAVFGGLLAGGVAAPIALASTQSADAAAWAPRALRVKQVRVGDLVLGPEGSSRRVAAVRRSGSRYRVLVTDDSTGRPVPLDARQDAAGLKGTAALVVLARDVPASAALFAGPRVFDAGDRTTSSLRLFRAAAAQWAEVDPVLGAGEPGFEIDTMRLKIGDGGARWSQLPYVAGAGAGGTVTQNYYVGADLTLPRPDHAGPVDWVTTADGIPTHIRPGDWVTRVEPTGS